MKVTKDKEEVKWKNEVWPKAAIPVSCSFPRSDMLPTRTDTHSAAYPISNTLTCPSRAQPTEPPFQPLRTLTVSFPSPPHILHIPYPHSTTYTSAHPVHSPITPIPLTLSEAKTCPRPYNTPAPLPSQGEEGRGDAR